MWRRLVISEQTLPSVSCCHVQAAVPPSAYVFTPAEPKLECTTALTIATRDCQRRLWIDAVCVNQKNLVERTSQVKLMSMVFKQAERVIAWIGVPDADTHLAFNFLTYLGARFTVQWHTGMIIPASPEYRGLCDSEEPLLITDQVFASIENILRRPWFWRVWIRQEIKLARCAIMLCGI